MTDVWMTDGYSNKALVPVAEVDTWIPRGWVRSVLPADGERVWMQHDAHGGRAQFPVAVVAVWGALGWAPSAPVDPVDLLKDPVLVDVETVPASVESAGDEAKPKTPARGAKPTATEQE